MKDLMEKIIQFRDERNWKQYHNPKDLAISLSIESSELLECFQWKSNEEAVSMKLENMKEEIADIAIYLLLLSHELDINLKQTIEEKLLKNENKYPVEKAFGSNKKYNELE